MFSCRKARCTHLMFTINGVSWGAWEASRFEPRLARRRCCDKRYGLALKVKVFPNHHVPPLRMRVRRAFPSFQRKQTVFFVETRIAIQQLVPDTFLLHYQALRATTKSPWTGL
jgi:hypothetical protein